MLLRGREHRGHLPSKQLAEELHHRQTVLRDFAQYRRQLRLDIQEYERKYEVDSADLPNALREGKIKENSEVVTWIMSYRELQDMEAD